MSNASTVQLNADLTTPVLVLSYPESKSALADPAHQTKVREAYETPGIIIVDNALDEGLVEALREGLSDKTRKFKQKFNEGIPSSPALVEAIAQAGQDIARITTELFGYRLPPKADSSFRPMISADEPIHFDSYHVEHGLTPLMSIFNFDRGERLWHVGPSFAEICALRREQVQELLADTAPGIPASLPLRVAAEKGHGPLSDADWTHKVSFAPNALWFSNPKIISHKLVYGRGALINTWMITEPVCKCQRCLLDQAGIDTRASTPPIAATA